MLTLDYIKKNKYINEFIRSTDHYIDHLGYTDHGFRHINIVADRCRFLAKKLKLSEKEIELASIAGYCHDIGNFLGRTQHHYWGAILFNQVFMNDPNVSPRDLAVISQAIADHDKAENKLVSKIAAILVIADKSDVARDRIKQRKINKELLENIHVRVNWYVLQSELKVFQENKIIRLNLLVDNAMSVMEYFEIFADRMAYSRLAAKYLGYKFQLKINNTILK